MPEQAQNGHLHGDPAHVLGWAGDIYLFVSLFSLAVTKQPDSITASFLSGVKLDATPLERMRLGKGYWLLASKFGTARVALLPMWVETRGWHLNHLGGVQIPLGTH